MHRTALARKHRPRRFGELVGQDHVASTLRAAVAGGRTGHAYLLCGPRGIGKTTAARVLAMALNCPHGEEGEPCGECESCERIWSGRASLDVVEIDAASHRGVDDARDLRERAMYAPTSEDRYKVYIVDEAHMLTRDAWNALLKILEEPPPRVIFAFATTEPGKIDQSAPPVLSRCQRFDFRRVSVADLLERLREVLAREGVAAEAGALLAIARRAEGGVRDALSLLDQVLSFAGDEVRSEDVRRMLGLVDEERYLEFFELLERGDRGEVFSYVQRLLDAGFDPVEFVRGLAAALRILLVLRADPDGDMVELQAESRDRFAQVAERFSEVDLLRYLLTVSDFETSGRFRRSSQQRIQLEVLLLRLVSMDSAVELEKLLSVISESAGPVGAAAGSDPDGSRGGSGRVRGGARGGVGAESGSVASPPPAEQAAPRPSDATADAPPDAPSGTSAEAPGDESTWLLRLWREALSETEGLGGQAVALRGVRVEGFEGGRVALRIPEGLADDLRSFLEDRRGSATLRERLAVRLETDPATLSFVVNPQEAPKRVTAGQVRAQRLAELVATDPSLREAVEELDLTLKD